MVLVPKSKALGLLIFVHISTHPSKLLQKTYTYTNVCLIKYNCIIQTTIRSWLAELFPNVKVVALLS